jgi:hypothetical protein
MTSDGGPNHPTGPPPRAIDGDIGDTLQLALDARGTWTQVATEVNLDGSGGGAYDVWTFDAGATDLIKLAVGHHVSVHVV